MMVDQNWYIGVNCVEITKHVVCDLNMLIYIYIYIYVCMYVCM